MKREYVGFEPNNLTVVSMKDGEKFALINNKGEKVRMLDVTNVAAFCGDLILFMGDDYCSGLMDTEGKVVIEPEYDYMDYNGGPIIAQDSGDKDYYVLDRQGKEIKTITAYRLVLPDETYFGYKDRILCYADSTTGYFLDGQGNRLPSSIEFSRACGRSMTYASTDYKLTDLLLKKLELTSESMMGSKIGASYSDLKDTSNPLLKGNRDYMSEDTNSKLVFDTRYIGNQIAHAICFDKEYVDSEGNVVPGVKAVSIYTFIGTGQHTEEMLDSLRKQAEKLGKFYQKMHFSKWDGEAYDLGEDRALFIAPLESKKGVVVYLGD